MTVSGNSQPLARTPAPATEETLENPPAETGALRFLLSSAVRTSFPIDPAPMFSNSGIAEYDPASWTAKPLMDKFLMEELFSSITGKTGRLAFR